MSDNAEKKRIQWHPAFCSAMKLELRKNKDSLFFQEERVLNTKPLQIDLLVIKKLEAVQIDSDIGKLFRKHNILEYKSPGDEMDEDVYLKVVAYALLYKVYEHDSGEISIEDITITLVREEKPIGLFKWFKRQGFSIKDVKSGIYYVERENCIPTQVIVTKELMSTSHEWLKALTRDAEEGDIRRLINSAVALKSKQEKQMADSVLQVTIEANKRKYQHVMEDEIMCEALRELFAPEVEELQKKLDEADARADKAEARAEEADARAEEADERAEQAGVRADEAAERAKLLQKKVDELEAQLKQAGIRASKSDL